MWPIKKNTGSDDSWTSVVFGTGRIEVASVRRRRDEKPVLLAYEAFAYEGGELPALKRMCSRHGLGRARCTTLLRYGEYQLVQTEPPQVPEAELRDALRWKIKEMVDFPVAEAGIDVLPMSVQTGRAAQIFVVAAPHTVLTPRIRLFQDAKAGLAAIDIPELAQRNIAALLEVENRGLALLAFNEYGGFLSFTYQGELLAVRHIDVSATDLAAASGNSEAVFEKALLDVQRSLDNFDRNFSSVTLSGLTVVPVAGVTGFVEYLQSNLYQMVGHFDLAQGMDLGGTGLTDPARQGEALLAIGAALREGEQGGARGPGES